MSKSKEVNWSLKKKHEGRAKKKEKVGKIVDHEHQELIRQVKATDKWHQKEERDYLDD